MTLRALLAERHYLQLQAEKHPSSPTAEAWESGVTRRPSRLKGRAGFGVSEAERLEGVSSKVHDHKRLGGIRESRGVPPGG